MNLLRFLKLLLLSIVIFMKKPKEKNNPKRLDKQVPEKEFKLDLNYRNILIFIIFLSIFCLSVYIVFKTGALESTRAYNNRLIE